MLQNKKRGPDVSRHGWKNANSRRAVWIFIISMSRQPAEISPNSPLVSIMHVRSVRTAVRAQILCEPSARRRLWSRWRAEGSPATQFSAVSKFIFYASLRQRGAGITQAYRHTEDARFTLSRRVINWTRHADFMMGPVVRGCVRFRLHRNYKWNCSTAMSSSD